MSKSETKPFPLRVVLTVTTERLLTEPKNGGNGIGALYEILGHMTGDSPFTHQLGRFGDECRPWLLKWFPELTAVNGCLKSLKQWIERDRTGTGEEGVKMWLAEIKLMFPDLKDVYDVPTLPKGAHTERHPITELCEIMKGKTV